MKTRDKELNWSAAVLIQRLAVWLGPLGDGLVIEGNWVADAWGEGNTARRYLLRDGFWGAVRLEVRDTRQAVWELAAPDGTCPPPGDLYCCSFEF